MNVFVVGSGRCGTMTFSRACSHITNFTSGHETSPGRMYFPDNHIEVDSHLCWYLPLVVDRYPEAYWVHLQRRNLWMNVRSFIGRPGTKLYSGFAYMNKLSDRAAATLLVRNANRLVEKLIPDAHKIYIEEPKTEFARFWDAIGAVGDLTAALLEFDVKYNATPRGHNRLKKVGYNRE